MSIRLPKMNFDPLPSKTAKTHIWMRQFSKMTGKTDLKW